MAERIAYLEAVIGADISQFRQATAEVRREAGSLATDFGGGFRAVGKSLTYALSAPIGILGSFATNTASDFDAAMRNINAIANLSEAELSQLSDRVLEFGKTTRGGAIDSANSLYTVFSAGLTDTALAFDVMETATMTAEAGLADMETTTEALVATMLAFDNATVAGAEQASDALTAMVQVGVGEMQDFAGAIGKVLPAAAGVGASVEDTFGTLAFLTQRGLSASESVTSLNTALTNMFKPTEDMQQALQSLGVNGVQELIDTTGGLVPALNAVVNTTDGTTEELGKLFSNIRGLRAMLNITKDLDGFNATMAEFHQILKGSTLRAYQQQMMSFSAQWDLMASALEAVSIKFGDVLLPLLAPIVNKITDFLLSITDLNPQIIQLAVGFAGLVAVLPPLLWLTGALLNPLGILSTIIIAVGIDFTRTAGSIQNAIDIVFGSLPVLQSAVNTLKGIISNVKPPSPQALMPYTKQVIAPKDLVEWESDDTVWDLWLQRDNQDISWDTFKNDFIALNGKLIPDIGDLIEIPKYDLTGKLIESFFVDTDSFMENLPQSDISAMGMVTFVEDDTLLERLQQAIETIIPDIPAILEEIGLAVASWFDTEFTKFFRSAGTTFTDFVSNFDVSSISDAINDIFNFDWSGTATQLFPNLLPELEKFINLVGNWFINDAIPMMAKGLGSFIANLGIVIGQLMSGIGSALQGSAPVVAGGVAQNIFEPFLEGYNEAIGEFETRTGQNVGAVDTILTGIAGALGATAIAKPYLFATMAVKLGSAIMTQLAKTKLGSTALTATSNFITSMGNAVSGAIGSTTFSVIMGTLVLAGLLYLILPEDVQNDIQRQLEIIIKGKEFVIRESINVTLGDQPISFTILDTFEETLETEINTWVAQSFGNLPTNLKTLLFEKFMEGDISLSELELVIPFQEMRVTPTGEVPTATRDRFWVSYVNSLIGGYNTLALYTAGMDELPEFKLDLAPEVQDRIIQTLVNEPTIRIDPFEYLDIVLLAGQLYIEAQQSGLSDGQQVYYDYYKGFTAGLSGATGLGGDTVQVDTGLDATDTTGVVDSGIELIDEETKQTMVGDATTIGTEVGTTMAESVGTAVAEEGMSAEDFNTNFLTPFSNNWLGVFGEEGTVRKSSTAFFAEFILGMANIVTTSTQTSNKIQQPLTILKNHMSDATSFITGKMKDARDSISDLLTEIRKLASVSTSLEISVRVTGTINAPAGEPTDVDSSNANGLEYVPRDGHIAELHKGEMVVPSTIASNLRRIGDVSKSILEGGTGRAGDVYTTQNNQINIYGVDNVDDLLAELERRGIYL